MYIPYVVLVRKVTKPLRMPTTNLQIYSKSLKKLVVIQIRRENFKKIPKIEPKKPSADDIIMKARALTSKHVVPNASGKKVMMMAQELSTSTENKKIGEIDPKKVPKEDKLWV